MRSWGAIAQKLKKSNIKQFGYWYDEKGIKHYGVKPDPIKELSDLVNDQFDIVNYELRARNNRN